MSDWQPILISDLGRVVTGKTPPTKQQEYYDGPYPFITPTDIRGDMYCETARSVSEEGRAFQKNLLLPARAICVTCIASVGKICMTSVPSFTNQQINSIIVDEAQYDPFFVYYLMQTQVDYLKRIAGGAASPIVNKSAFSEIEVFVPDLPTQRRIAGILSAYDELIANNQRRIAILEEMARALYREWFVHYRAPGVVLGEDGVPEGWEVKPLQALMSNQIGGGWGKDVEDEEHTEAAYVIRGADIPEMRMSDNEEVPFRYHTPSNLRSRRLIPGDIIFEVSGGTKDRPVGRTLLMTEEILSAFDSDVICASFCKRITPDEDAFGAELLYLSLREGYDSGEIEQYQVQSTGLSNFKWTEYIEQTTRLVPPPELRDRFKALVKPMFSQMTILGLQAMNLRRTRDLLLPRLMSGRVELEPA